MMSKNTQCSHYQEVKDRVTVTGLRPELLVLFIFRTSFKFDFIRLSFYKAFLRVNIFYFIVTAIVNIQYILII